VQRTVDFLMEFSVYIIYICVYIYTHTYIHTHIYACRDKSWM
jgi:hypothetical protein